MKTRPLIDERQAETRFATTQGRSAPTPRSSALQNRQWTLHYSYQVITLDHSGSQVAVFSGTQAVGSGDARNHYTDKQHHLTPNARWQVIPAHFCGQGSLLGLRACVPAFLHAGATHCLQAEDDEGNGIVARQIFK